jgi:FlaA1/EpsC-like NDP-sugar epimerase
MAKLDGKIILIAGGAGNVGEGIVATFLEETAAELPLPRISPVRITAAG